MYIFSQISIKQRQLLDQQVDSGPLVVQLCKNNSRVWSSCRIRSDRQTTSLTLTTGVCEAGTKMRGASNMNIHYDVTGLLTAAWRSHLGQIVWAA